MHGEYGNRLQLKECFADTEYFNLPVLQVHALRRWAVVVVKGTLV